MKLEIFEAGYYYHVFNRGNNRENLFYEEKNYLYFLELMKKHLSSVCDIYCYCLLPNHFHLLIKMKDEKLIPEKYKSRLYQPFSNLFNSYTKSFNKVYDRTGSLFQKHPHRIRVTSEMYMLHLISYIHLNPVKHGFSNDFYNYPYSSMISIINGRNSFVESQKVIELFENRENLIYWHDINKIRFSPFIEDLGKIDE